MARLYVWIMCSNSHLDNRYEVDCHGLQVKEAYAIPSLTASDTWTCSDQPIAPDLAFSIAVCLYARIYLGTYICVYVYMYVCVCLCMYVCVGVHRSMHASLYAYGLKVTP